MTLLRLAQPAIKYALLTFFLLTNCNGYDLRSSVSLVDLGFSNSQGSDIWGWTDPITNKEYAIMCTSQGTSFIDLSDPEKL